MEIVLEQDEIERLLRKALLAEGIGVPSTAKMVIRRNNKKGTIRLAFKGESGQPALQRSPTDV
jgi:hypothetical protein